MEPVPVYIKGVGCAVILKRPDFHRPLLVIVYGTVLCHRSACGSGLGILCGTLQNDQCRRFGHFRSVLFKGCILVAFQLTCYGDKAMISMTVSEAVLLPSVFICYHNGRFAKIAVSVGILYVIICKIEVRYDIGPDD